MQGCDPYDLLASTLRLDRLGSGACFALTQLHKRSPVSLRGVLRIPPQRIPKAYGLLLAAYADLHRCEAGGLIAPVAGNAAEARLRPLFRWLLDNAVATRTGICWGLPFAYASRVEMIAAGTPSLVVTAFVHRGIWAYHRETGDPEALSAMRSCCRFVLDDLPRFESDDGLCFAYTPTNPIRCYNATMLAAEMLARTWALTGEAGLLEPARRTVDFVLRKQHDDGHWAYAAMPRGGEKQQIDFHQGFVLSSLLAYATFSSDSDPRIETALRQGGEYYRRVQFTDDGRSLWRIPRRFPTDIHHQAQGVLTFVDLSVLSRDYLLFAERIAQWTIENMQDRAGYFHYRRGRWFSNRIDYVRWGQAWMMRALISLLQQTSTEVAA